MTTRRTAKLARAILEQVSTSILFDLKDPRVRNVTVTRVDLSPDAQRATVCVSIRGSEKDESLCLKGLQSARGFLQAKVAARIKTRYTPLLSFVVDHGVKRSALVSRLLREVLPEISPPLSGESLPPAEPQKTPDGPAGPAPSPEEPPLVP